MQSLDVLFRRFIEEMKSEGANGKQLKRYTLIYQCFRKILPDISIDYINTNTVLYFYEKLRIKLRKAEHRHSNNNFSFDSAMLACMAKLGSFFNWLKYNGYISENPLNELDWGVINNKDDFKRPYANLPKIDKLRLYIALRKHSFITKQRIKNTEIFDNNAKNELYSRQLRRIYNSFFLLSEPVFYQGIADYVKYISEHPGLIYLIKENIFVQAEEVFNKACRKSKIVGAKSSNEILLCVKEEYDNLSKQMQNSYWGAWFNLELVYLIIYSKIKEVFKLLKDHIDLIIDYCTLSCELDLILENDNQNSSVNFKRHEYSIFLNRIHNFILEKLEEKNITEESKPELAENVIYKYSQYGIPSGELLIKDYESIQFVKTPATALYFLYSHRKSNKYFSYSDFNKYQGAESKQLSSNEFRLLIESINNRVNSHTSGFIKTVIVKQTVPDNTKSLNRYKWNKNYPK